MLACKKSISACNLHDFNEMHFVQSFFKLLRNKKSNISKGKVSMDKILKNGHSCLALCRCTMIQERYSFVNFPFNIVLFVYFSLFKFQSKCVPKHVCLSMLTLLQLCIYGDSSPHARSVRPKPKTSGLVIEANLDFQY